MSRRSMILFSVLAMMTATCGGEDSVGSTTIALPGVTTTSVSPTTATPTTITAAPTTAAPTTTTTTPTQPPQEPVPPGAMLVTNEDGVYVATLNGATSQVIAASPNAIGGLIAFAIDDTSGGIIFQPNRDPWRYEGDDSIVYWVPQGAAVGQELLVPAPDQGIGLEDVVSIGDTTSVLYTRVEGKGSPDTARQTLRSFDMDSRAVAEIGLVGGWESGSSPISGGGASIVTNGAGEAFFWINFMDTSGAIFDSTANPMPDGEFDCVPDCFWYADLSPDGTQVAFGRIAPNADGFPTVPEIEVREVATGELIMNATLPEIPAIGWIHSLDLIDGFVLINVVEEGSEYPAALILEVRPGKPTGYFPAIGGVARFLRSMPELDGVVSWP